MRVPDRLQPLLDHGVIEEVLRPLMSGKEAEIYLVISSGEERVAKVYKNAQYRSFQHRAEYTEGRRVRSSREQRAMSKRSKHGREKTEEAWRSAEVDAIQLLRGSGVRVPEPYVFSEGVLVMELVRGPDGEPAPRMVDIAFSPEEATALFHTLIREVVKMLCAGIIHADLSDFNVLITEAGPVIIDFPQAVDPARNQSARKLLLRDVHNLTSFLGRFAPALRRTKYGEEMWALYERSELEPDTELTGEYKDTAPKAEVNSLLEDILQLEQEARERREALGLPPPRRRKPIVRDDPPPKPNKPQQGKPQQGKPQQGKPQQGRPPSRGPEPATEGAPDAPKKRRRRRRGRSGSDGASQEGSASTTAPQGQQQQQRPAPPKQSGNPAPSSGDAPAGEGTRRRRRRRRRRGGGGGSGGGGGGGGGQNE